MVYTIKNVRSDLKGFMYKVSHIRWNHLTV